MRLSVVLDCVDLAMLASFWETALGYHRVDAPEGYAALVPQRGETGPVLLLQRVPEPKTAKNRMHLDLHPQDPRAHVEALELLGARRVGGWVDELVAEGVRWQVLIDPEGNEFCVVEHVAEAADGR
jgi:catechol 2,3-dioxygenase-like lactoylglutathione lyase family enzyme